MNVILPSCTWRKPNYCVSNINYHFLTLGFVVEPELLTQKLRVQSVGWQVATARRRTDWNFPLCGSVFEGLCRASDSIRVICNTDLLFTILYQQMHFNISYNVHILYGTPLHVSALWCHPQGRSTFLAKITHNYNFYKMCWLKLKVD